MNTLRRERLVDKLVEAYVDWLEMCARVSDAYRSWASETGPGDGLTFGLYMSALDAEEHAADVYAGLVRRVGELHRRGDAQSGPLGGPAWGVGWP